ncbi:MAG: chorismate-binding protein, partial [Candidatus Omnitrophota bacterium]|nr:chorismate-binding protein [Candidatus Omnitrophota bacterium]
MYKPSFEEFRKLSKKGNVIPVYKEINADLDTPVSSYLKIQKGDYGFLLESVEGQEKLARFSFLGSDPCLVFVSKGRDIRISYPGKKKTVRFKTAQTPLDEIKSIMQDKKAVAVSGLPPFCGGLVGYMGYDTVRFFERLPDKNPDDLKLPDAVFMLTDTMMIFDHINHTIKIINNVFLPTEPVGAGFKPAPTIAQMKRLYDKAIKKIKEIEKDFKKPVRDSVGTAYYAVPTKPVVSSNFTKAGFKAIVLRAKKYITEGDIIQVVPSQRFKLMAEKAPFQVYRDLRSLNPSPYMYFLKLKGFYIAGSSPEMLVRCENGIIQTRPIAGTRPRGRNEQEDVKLEKELLADQKERAEHLMLVDLGRNDIGRVAKCGTVKVSEFMSIERYTHVMHLVSEVRGILDRDKYSVYDV